MRYRRGYINLALDDAIGLRAARISDFALTAGVRESSWVSTSIRLSILQFSLTAYRVPSLHQPETTTGLNIDEIMHAVAVFTATVWARHICPVMRICSQWRDGWRCGTVALCLYGHDGLYGTVPWAPHFDRPQLKCPQQITQRLSPFSVNSRNIFKKFSLNS